MAVVHLFLAGVPLPPAPAAAARAARTGTHEALKYRQKLDGNPQVWSFWFVFVLEGSGWVLVFVKLMAH